MRQKIIRSGSGLGVVGVTALLLSLTAPAAFADYAPLGGDVVGVGSDTVQYASDFVADSDHLGDTGYNALGNVNRLVNLDATPDSGARLAYASAGVGTGQCAPGTGGTVGTGSQTTTHADSPCTLNPEVVLREGTVPVLRPNGSGAGYKALVADIAGGGVRYLDYARASSAQGAQPAGSPAIDSITIGTDPLQMLATTTPATHAVALSVAQLNSIYTCASTTWTQVGGTSSNTIIPVLPQVGSGTRSSFLKALGNGTAITPGACVKTAEENDPTALAAQTSPADAIEPMSGGRLNLFQGKLGSGAANATPPIPYFTDPSCPLKVTTPAACVGSAKTLNPPVAFTTGTPSDAGALFSISRPLYIYFRDSDIASTTPFQPGSTLNWVRTLLYNPCSGAGCTGFGPGGAPYYASSAGQALISAAGINPTYSFTPNGP